MTTFTENEAAALANIAGMDFAPWDMPREERAPSDKSLASRR